MPLPPDPSVQHLGTDGIQLAVPSSPALGEAPSRDPADTRRIHITPQTRNFLGRASNVVATATAIASLLFFMFLIPSTVVVSDIMETFAEWFSDLTGWYHEGNQGVYSFSTLGFIVKILNGFVVILPMITLLMIPVAYVAIYVIPMIPSLIFSAPVVVSWRDPPRVLLLRPFNRGGLDRPLKKLVRRQLSGHAHTYTLADASFKVPWYVRFPMLLGQLALFSFRFPVIRHREQVDKLRRALARSWLRNVNWGISFNKVFAVRVHDRFWRRTVIRLLSEVDVVIIDVTQITQNMRWEIRLCHRLDVSQKLILLARDREFDAVKQDVLASFELADLSSRLFAYDESGVVHRPAFDRKLAELFGRSGTDRPMSAVYSDALVLISILFSLNLALVLWEWTPWFEMPSSWVLPTTSIGILALLAVASWRSAECRFLAVIQLLVVGLSNTTLVAIWLWLALLPLLWLFR